jgi:hypothetical protein
MADTPMGLFDKTNPRATRRSVIRRAVLGAISIPAVFFAFGKPDIRANWPVLLPVFAILGAGICALAEWQIDDGPDKPDDESWSEAFDT